MAAEKRRKVSWRWRSAASASSMAISAPARFTSHDQPVTRDTVLGVLSLILWALIVTVTLKYVLILLRADNNGEGGTLSLTALASRALGRRTAFVFIVGVIGAAMFLGDSVITPAISVLSAVEGLKLASPAFSDYVAPLAVAYGLIAVACALLLLLAEAFFVDVFHVTGGSGRGGDAQPRASHSCRRSTVAG